jgi:D-beta-D-heptose 7-phosphate kinase/D-beta-D-heptose 1-phosphate adenosyltransferase
MLNLNEKASVLYHDLFDYPLNFSDLIRWQLLKTPTINQNIEVVNERGFYFLKGREGLIYKRLLRKRISTKKIKIAKRASRILSFLPGIRMVAVTGSLAMQNSSEKSDIDLMIITKKGSLWTTRLLSYLLLNVMRLALRRPNDGNQKDKLCLNMWIDESDMVWLKKDRNLYTAHEIAQIVPLINKDKTYEKFLFQNKWILSYWPSAVVIKKLKVEKPQVRIGLLERIAYNIQLNHMKSRITREVITPTRALFHPQDWGKMILGRLT